MKQLIKIILSLFFLILINSCATPTLWDGHEIGGADIRGFFIDKSGSRIVLVGAKNPETNLGMHYAIKDESGKMVKVFEMGQEWGEDFGMNMYSPEARGNKVYDTGMIMGFTIKENAPKEISDQIKELAGKYYYINAINGRKEVEYHFAREEDLPFTDTMNRYPSSKEPLKTLCSYEPAEYDTLPPAGYLGSTERQILISQPKPKETNPKNCIQITLFKKPWKGVIKDNLTIPETVIRVVATPVAVAIDVVLSPLYFIGILGMGVGSKGN